MPLLMSLVLQAAASDPVPSENDVKAGWVGFLVVILLVVAVVFLLRSFTRQLKKVEDADEAGVYDEKPDGGSDGSDVPPTTAEQDR
jgi:cell division septation protein DedD